MNSSDISELLEKYLYQIEKILKASIKSKIPMSKRISQHIVLKAGKRFRPILLLLSYLVFKAKPSARVYNAAAAVEILHNASLLHDDIVDNSSMRRGQKTSNLIMYFVYKMYDPIIHFFWAGFARLTDVNASTPGPTFHASDTRMT